MSSTYTVVTISNEGEWHEFFDSKELALNYARQKPKGVATVFFKDDELDLTTGDIIPVSYKYYVICETPEHCFEIYNSKKRALSSYHYYAHEGYSVRLVKGEIIEKSIASWKSVDIPKKSQEEEEKLLYNRKLGEVMEQLYSKGITKGFSNG